MRATRSRQKSGVKYFEAKPSMDLDDFRNQLQRKARVDSQQQAEDAAENAEEAAAHAAETPAFPPSVDTNGAQPMDTDALPGPAPGAADRLAASQAAIKAREDALDRAREEAKEKDAREAEERMLAEAALEVGR